MKSSENVAKCGDDNNKINFVLKQVTEGHCFLGCNAV